MILAEGGLNGEAEVLQKYLKLRLKIYLTLRRNMKWLNRLFDSRIKEEIVFLPIQVILFAGFFPKKEIALRIQYDTLQPVKITEAGKLNYEVTLTTDTDTIRLSVQNKEWSEFRSAETAAAGNSFLNVGVFPAAGKGWKSINWHRQNLDNTFSLLQNLPQYEVSWQNQTGNQEGLPHEAKYIQDTNHSHTA